MKVLIVGGGGREHAIALKIKENPEVTALYAAPGNGGIAQIATCLPFKATDVDGIVRWAAENKVDFVIVAPDDPLCLGMVDALAEQGIPAFGPRKNAAIIEGSKVFSKNLMKKYGIPTAAYETFDDYDAAVKYLQTADMPIVVKADGLALGKGVLICPDRESAVEAVASMMKEAKFGASGARVMSRLVAFLLKGLAFDDAVSRAIAGVHASLEATLAQGVEEFDVLAAAPAALGTPYRFRAERLA